MTSKRVDNAPAGLTLRDVSELSGVSEMTVSRVMRNVGDVSEKTRARVLEAARSLGYVPNKIAGALASQTVNLVGVVFPSLSSMVFPEVLAGITEVLEDTGLQPVVGVTGYSLEKEEKVIYEMLSWRPSGLIVAGLEHTGFARRMMKNARVPVVEIMDVDGEAVDFNVGISHLQAGREMARQILAHGYRKIGFVGTKMSQDFRAGKRLQGFEDALAEQGVSLTDREFYSGVSTLLKGRELTQAILARSPDLDCLYYSSDMIAGGGLMHCRDNGIDVPDRLGIAGFNALELMDGMPIKIATMDARRREIGAEAARIIARGKPALGTSVERKIELEPTFSAGETLRPLANS